MMNNRYWIAMYKSPMIRCIRCSTLEVVGQRITKRTNLGFGCCVPMEMVPQNWATSDAPQWIVKLRN